MLHPKISSCRRYWCFSKLLSMLVCLLAWYQLSATARSYNGADHAAWWSRDVKNFPLSTTADAAQQADSSSSSRQERTTLCYHIIRTATCCSVPALLSRSGEQFAAVVTGSAICHNRRSAATRILASMQAVGSYPPPPTPTPTPPHPTPSSYQLAPKCKQTCSCSSK